ncbi:MAG: hypothetical protein ACI8PT_002477 [Gammaproteobacteria bacterium]|jgi:hypothetical protein
MAATVAAVRSLMAPSADRGGRGGIDRYGRLVRVLWVRAANWRSAAARTDSNEDCLRG